MLLCQFTQESRNVACLSSCDCELKSLCIQMLWRTSVNHVFLWNSKAYIPKSSFLSWPICDMFKWTDPAHFMVDLSPPPPPQALLLSKVHTQTFIHCLHKHIIPWLILLFSYIWAYVFTVERLKATLCHNKHGGRGRRDRQEREERESGREKESQTSLHATDDKCASPMWRSTSKPHPTYLSLCSTKQILCEARAGSGTYQLCNKSIAHWSVYECVCVLCSMWESALCAHCTEFICGFA